MRGLVVALLLVAGCFSSSVDVPELVVRPSETSWPGGEVEEPLGLPVGFGGELRAEYRYESGQVLAASDTIWSWEPAGVIEVPDASTGSSAAVLGIAAGEATVTVRADRYQIEDEVELVVWSIVAVTIDAPDVEVQVGGTVEMHAVAEYEDGNLYGVDGSTAGAAEWTSDATEVATVEGGVVTGVAPGEATISAAFEGMSGSIAVTVAN